MENVEDCPGFETFGADVKAVRKAKYLSFKTMAEIINVDARYLANIENDGTIPRLPVVIHLNKERSLPVERYFDPKAMWEESSQRQRVSHKLKLCIEQYLPIIEGAIDGAAIGLLRSSPERTFRCVDYSHRKTPDARPAGLCVWRFLMGYSGWNG